jgi:hypothetical protein
LGGFGVRLPAREVRGEVTKKRYEFSFGDSRIDRNLGHGILSTN